MFLFRLLILHERGLKISQTFSHMELEWLTNHDSICPSVLLLKAVQLAFLWIKLQNFGSSRVDSSVWKLRAKIMKQKVKTWPLCLKRPPSQWSQNYNYPFLRITSTNNLLEKKRHLKTKPDRVFILRSVLKAMKIQILFLHVLQLSTITEQVKWPGLLQYHEKKCSAALLIHRKKVSKPSLLIPCQIRDA